METFKEKMKENKAMIRCQGADLLEAESMWVWSMGEAKAYHLN